MTQGIRPDDIRHRGFVLLAGIHFKIGANHRMTHSLAGRRTLRCPSLLIFTMPLLMMMSSAAQAGQTDSKTASKIEEDSTYPFDVILDSSYNRGTYQAAQVSQVAALTPTLDWTLFSDTTLSASLPFLLQHAPRGTIGGAHRGGNRGVREPEITTSGLGDVLLGVDQDLLTQGDSIPVDVSVFGNVKLGTAEVSKGLGSGKNDYSLGGHIGHEWGKYSLTAEGGYTLVGDPGRVTANGVTTILRFQNVVFGALDGTYDLSDQLSLGAGLDVSESCERKLKPPATVNLNAAYHVTGRIIVKGTVLAGLNTDSPNAGVSLSAAMAL
jgi:hypothetical protein